jgi:hypothetical protein
MINYNKDNKCSLCEGAGGWTFIHDNDPSGGPVFHPCYCDDGTRVGQLLADLQIQCNDIDRMHKDYNELKAYVEKTSTCKTCHGDQDKTLGLCFCKECGLPGKGYWPA